MNPATFIQGSAHDLAQIPDKSVQVITTSPPYYGLRAYCGEQDVNWPAVDYSPMPGLPAIRIDAMRCPLGNEPELAQYIAHLILCLREWRKKLRDDGLCFVNLGDSFAGSGGAGGDYNDEGLRARQPKFKAGKANGVRNKSLMLVPARFALAAIADGWIVRNAVIGQKTSPMPESVLDRFTRAHEYIYMMSLQPNYFCDMEAIKEEAIKGAAGSTFTKGKTGVNGHGRVSQAERIESGSRNPRDVIEWKPAPFASAHFAVWPESIPERFIKLSTSERGCCPTCGAPWRRIVERKPMVLARTHNHPPELRTRPSGTMLEPPSSHTIGWLPTCDHYGIHIPEGLFDPLEQPEEAEEPFFCETCDGTGQQPGPPLFPEMEVPCAACGARGQAPGNQAWTDWQAARGRQHDQQQTLLAQVNQKAETIPCTVLDPFSGSGTTVKVAVRLRRRGIGIEISEQYLEEATNARFGEGVQMQIT